MSTTVQPVELTSDRRRELASVLLRGDLQHYDTVAAQAQVINTLIDELLLTTVHQERNTAWDVAADRLIRRFAYRAAPPNW